MSDPHLNIFHSYRGPSKSDTVQLQQLEDNLTRALVITLNHLKESPARFPLLLALGVDESHLDQRYQCYLQVTTPGPEWPDPQKRHLLVIHGGPRLELMPGIDTGGEGRADAVIALDDYLIAIESKLGNQVERTQLDRHRTTLSLCGDDFNDITWPGISRCLRNVVRSDDAGTVANFVLSQCEEYLRMNGFGGLNYDHFGFFAQAPEHRDGLVKDGIRRILGQIGDEIVGSMGGYWESRLLNIAADAIGAWVVVEPDPDSREPHITVAIDASSLEIFANVELQNAYETFQTAWRDDAPGLINIVRRLGSDSIRTSADVPWRFRVRRRVPLGRPRHYHYWQSVDVAANTLATWPAEDMRRFIDGAIAKPEGEAAPEIMLVKSYSVPFAVESDDLMSALVQDAQHLAPYFSWLGTSFPPLTRT